MSLLDNSERRRFTAEEVGRMVEVGILDEDEPLELLDGELIVMTPQSPVHAMTAEKVRRLLERAYGPGYHTRTHSPLAAGPTSLPEPDISVCRGAVEDYGDRHPSGQDVELVVEIATTSRLVDRAKAPIYALAGVPTYWLLDIPNRRLEVRSDPRLTGEYLVAGVLDASGEVEIPGTGQRIAVVRLLP